MKIPPQIPLDKDGQYCLNCFASKIKRIFQNGLTYYHCEACGQTLERSLVIDHKITWWIDKENGEYWHEGVGIFLFNKQGEALFFKRTIYPFVLTIPAGHLDLGEDPKNAVKRELEEETGIITSVDNITLFVEEDIIGDECRRGCDNHRWHLYVTQIEKPKNININDEGGGPIWLRLEEALEHDLTYPIQFFIKKYGHKILERTKKPSN